MMISFKKFNVRKFLLFVTFDIALFGGFAYYFSHLSPDTSVAPQAFVFDNGLDYVVEGVSRFVKDNKIGFVNEKQEIVIPAQFDRASPFKNGQADVCNGCVPIPDGEHTLMTGGTWGTLTKDGKVTRKTLD